MIKVDVIKREDYLSFIAGHPLGNFMQYPSWAEVKTEWKHDLLGWFEGTRLVGCALVLYRKMPYLNQYLAYIPRGPLIEWDNPDLAAWFKPLFAFLKRRHAFGLKIEPPVVAAKWCTPKIKDFLKTVRDQDLHGKQLRDLPPDIEYSETEKIKQQLLAMGWRYTAGNGGFTAVQPQYVFRLPLKGRTLEEIFKGFHTNWQRNVKKADRLGVKVRVGTEQDLPAFYKILELTSARDRFKVRGFSYFQEMYRALSAEDPNRIRLYLAEDDEEVLAATLAVYVNGQTWYLYGASSNEKREKAPNHALQWRMIQDAYALGAHTYDFRGISNTLDESDHLFGLLRFKLGFGGEACELIGEWDYPLQPLVDWAFNLYMKRRG